MTGKIFSIIVILSLCISSVAMANKNPRDDENLFLFYQHQGYDYFLKKDSLEWEYKNSLRYVEFEYIVYDSRNPARTNWDDEKDMEFAYDVAKRKVYFVGEDDTLRFLDPNGTIAKGSGYAWGAEKIYYLVFGEKFYGTYNEDFYD
jgi:hypothetical protein